MGRELQLNLKLAEKERLMTTQFPSIFGTKDLDKFLVGYDKVFDRLREFHDEATKNIPNYPPYNIKKTADNQYVIEMAVAGFGKQDITIETEGDKLVIKGNAEGDTDESVDTLYQGLALRPFTRMFTLNDQVEVQNAEMVNGLLRISLERLVPESQRKQIEIS
jgi:molecular chaperone IbpA